MARPTKTDLLASPLKKFAESKAEVAIYDYYDGPFQFVESSILSLDGVDSDIEPLLAVLSEKDEVCVEIGAGDGRLFPALLSKSNRLIAYEKSMQASKLAMKKADELSSVAQFQGAVSVVNDDFLTAVSCDQTPSVFVLGSLSMNLFLEDEIDSLLEKCVQTAPHAALVFGVFAPDSVADFEKYDTRIGSSVHLDALDMSEALQASEPLWILSLSNFVPENQWLIQNWFMDAGSFQLKKRYAIAAAVEKIWCIDTLLPYLKDFGYEVVAQAPFKVREGGANGLDACMYRVERQ